VKNEGEENEMSVTQRHIRDCFLRDYEGVVRRVTILCVEVKPSICI